MLTAFVNFLLAASSVLTDSGNFLRVAATPLAVFESFVPVPEAVSTAFLNSLLAAASLLTDSANFLRVGATPLAVFESSDPVLEPL